MRRNRPSLGPDDGPTSSLECPYCSSSNTTLERNRGPGRCRTVHYCHDCEQPFEEFG